MHPTLVFARFTNKNHNDHENQSNSIISQLVSDMNKLERMVNKRMELISIKRNLLTTLISKRA